MRDAIRITCRICLLAALVMGALSACAPQHTASNSLAQYGEEVKIRVHGVILDARTHQPARSAIMTIGSPKSSFEIQQIPVDTNGEFDFIISGIDQSKVYVWNGQSGSRMAFQRLNRSDMRGYMTLYLPTPSAASSHGVSNEYYDPWAKHSDHY